MDAAVLIARIVLAAVLAAAGAAKLRDLGGSRAAMAGFGVPERLAPAAGIALPVVELALAVALVVPGLARTGAVLALVLLLAMTAAIAQLLRRGEAPECHCFGALHSAPVSRATLGRSAALAVLAGFAAAYGPGSDLGRAGPFGLEAIVVLLASTAAALAGRSQAPRRPPLFPDAPSRGERAPRFDLPHARAGRSSLDELLAGADMLVLVFVDTACGPCRGLLASLAGWRETLDDALRIVVISRGDREANVALCEQTGLPDVLVQQDAEVTAAYGVGTTPSAILLAGDGTVARGPAAGAAGVEALLRVALVLTPGLDGARPAA